MEKKLGIVVFVGEADGFQDQMLAFGRFPALNSATLADKSIVEAIRSGKLGVLGQISRNCKTSYDK